MTSKYFIKPTSVGSSGLLYWAIFERTWRGVRVFGTGGLMKQDAERALVELQAHEREQRMGGSQNTQTP